MPTSVSILLLSQLAACLLVVTTTHETYMWPISPLPHLYTYTGLVDLSIVPTKRVISVLADMCPCPPEAAALRALATEEEYKKKIAGRRLTIIELLLQYRSVPITINGLVSMLPRMAPRYYSISSSPLTRPGTASITVGRVEFTTPSGRVHRGACSASIGDTPVGGTIIGCVRKLSSSFRLPSDPAVPVIMVGPGALLHSHSATTAWPASMQQCAISYIANGQRRLV